jgi:type II secretory ATPase GspE/PulE/Tfp pilus assembly ATPase PilB-like protein
MDRVKIDPRWALRIPGNLAIRRQMLPFTMEGDVVLVACANPQDESGLQAVQRQAGITVKAQAAEPESLQRAIDRVFRFGGVAGSGAVAPARISISENADERDIEGDVVVALGNEILHAATVVGATDIHIEPAARDVRIRLRVDGTLDEYRRVPRAVHSALISRFKVLAGMDIAERRAPQDGRFSIGYDRDATMDIRAATIPTRQGERLTLRLLAGNTANLTLDRLGMSPTDLAVFQQAIDRPNGLILLNGPTGCGKSTTLYAAIRHMLGKRNLNVITIEDPVEYLIDGVSQVEVDTVDKVSFHKALRSALRHDPDVLMIGEIRDELTAEIAVKAALTGHLVFSTLHTNSAPGTITRLIDMGIQPFLLGAVSRLYVAQRLVRRLCVNCRAPLPATAPQAAILQTPGLCGKTIFAARGCKFCNGTGYLGRTGVFELFLFDADTVRLVSEVSGSSDIEQMFDNKPRRQLIEDGIAKLLDGLTSFEELQAGIPQALLRRRTSST